MTRTPNFLFILSDEHQAQAMHCAGHPQVQTPNIDRLANRGTRFVNAYTPSPICVPARASLATGRYVHQTGYWDNAHAYDGRVRGWGHVLLDAGIPVTSIGKLHYRSDGDPTGFDRQILPMHIHEGVGQLWGSVRNPLPPGRDAQGMLGQVGPGVSKYNSYDRNIAAEAANWLMERSGADSPWMGFVGFVAPHFPLTVPQEFLDLYPAAEMPLPPVRKDAGYVPHPWVARMNDIEDSDSELGTDDRRREAIAAYFALCTFMDSQVGRVIEALEASGQDEDTIVIYSSDHGESLGMRGRWGKSVLYRESTQVPLILAGPDIGQGTCATPVSLIDVAPTVMDAFGLPPDADWPGQSLVQTASAPDDAGRIVFSEYHAANSATGGFMLADARWKYHYYVDYEPELFDLEADPLEATNLAGQAAYLDQESRLHAELNRICVPKDVDAAAKSDQDRLVTRFGGPEIAFRKEPFGATPVSGN